jgi:hypothetical protein
MGKSSQRSHKDWHFIANGGMELKKRNYQENCRKIPEVKPLVICQPRNTDSSRERVSGL